MSKKTKREERERREAAAAEARRRADRKRNLLTGIAVLAALVLVVGGGFLIAQNRDSSDDATADRTSDYAVEIGEKDAEHSIVIYEDFLCPSCRDLEAASRDLLADAAEAGDVYVSYRPFNLFSDASYPRREYSVDAAAAFAVVLEQSGPEVANTFHDLLFENQPSESGPFPDADVLVDLAVEAGAEEAEVRPGIEDGSGEEWVEQANAEAADAGVSSTPTILLDGEVYQSGSSWEDIANGLVEAVR